jgi:subtilisin-like proprotein convertase family protein
MRGRACAVVLMILAATVSLTAAADAGVLDLPAEPGTLGTIPAGGGCGNPLDVAFAVPATAGVATDVGVTFELAPVHGFVGDVDVTLIAPNGFAHQILAPADPLINEDSNLAGPYTFSDSAPASPTFWEAASSAVSAAPVPSGSYRASDSAGNNTLITPTFADISPVSGTWKLRFCDRVTADTGTVSAATLHLSTSGSNPGPASPTQFVSLDVADSGQGVLGIALERPGLDFSEIIAGSTADVGVGDITYFNTLGTGAPWGAGVAATNLVSDTDTILYTDLSITPGATITPLGSIAVGGGGSFDDSEEPGTYSEVLMLVVGSPDDQGQFVQSGSTLAVDIPLSAQAGSYTGTLQYTIVG